MEAADRLMSPVTILLIIGTLVISSVVFVLLWKQTGQGKKNAQNTREKSRTQKKSRPKPANPYRAVSIRAGLIRCPAVETVEGRRYLVAENDVPELPLGSCNVDKCECKYVHHKDRRDGDDRRSIIGISGNIHVQTGQEERRVKRGRRKSDME